MDLANILNGEPEAAPRPAPSAATNGTTASAAPSTAGTTPPPPSQVPSSLEQGGSEDTNGQRPPPAAPVKNHLPSRSDVPSTIPAEHPSVPPPPDAIPDDRPAEANGHSTAGHSPPLSFSPAFTLDRDANGHFVAPTVEYDLEASPRDDGPQPAESSLAPSAAEDEDRARKEQEKARVDEERRIRRNMLQQQARERKKLEKQEAERKRLADNARRRAEREAAKVAKEAVKRQQEEEAATLAAERARKREEDVANGLVVETMDLVEPQEDQPAAAPPTDPMDVDPPVEPTPKQTPATASPIVSGKRKRTSVQDASPLAPGGSRSASVHAPSPLRTSIVPINGPPSAGPSRPPPPPPFRPPPPALVYDNPAARAVPGTDFLPSGKPVSPAVARGSRPAWGYELPWGSGPYAGLPDQPNTSLVLSERAHYNPRALAEKRWSMVEDRTRDVWAHIAKKEIPKLAKLQQAATSSRALFAKRLSTLTSREARRILAKTKPPKEVQNRNRRIMRELLTYYRGNEKRERETKKKAEKEALDKAKKEEEMREAKRAARKLNFLITQTELYSHFVGSKIKTKEAEESEDTAGAAPPQVVEGAEAGSTAATALDATAATGPTAAELAAIDFDDEDETNLRAHAARNAQKAVDDAKAKAQAFDEAAAAANAAGPSTADLDRPVTGIDIDRDDLNFQNPTMAGDIQVKQPDMLMAELKEYQLKGLNWLANLYEQGINGILADEMGLGKTVQSISLMAYLAEVHNIWGPFLVIAPASTLHNWQQEISRFVPTLKALPYWGNVKDRAVLRKFWNRKSLRYDKDAPFHVLITSYQLVVADEKYFQRVKWQYMVLDEAQAIKSSGSTRWKTLLGFHCRNRLLLTGTPIQNSMTELWALLHFIMPQLFDSHEEFSEWFSKDIESSAEKAGGMNEHQLRRLHMILKPFMLRRIKKNVQNELGDKIEIDVACGLTPRQKLMYGRLRENMSIADLIQRATSLNNDDVAVKRLMNLIMQFRKVCNHPELFERADVTAPLSFARFNGTANPARDADFSECPYSVRSLIELEIPKTVYREGGIRTVPGPASGAGSDSLHLARLMNIWATDNLRQAARGGGSTPSWARLLGMSAGEVHRMATEPAAQRVPALLARTQRLEDEAAYASLTDSSLAAVQSTSILSRAATLPRLGVDGLPPLSDLTNVLRETSRLSRPDLRFLTDAVVAPPAELYCSDRSCVDDQRSLAFDPIARSSLFGLSPRSIESTASVDCYSTFFSGLSPRGILGSSPKDQVPQPAMQVPQLEKLMLDSGKLARLDSLLTELKAGGHRVLVYFQMTKMIDLMEEYLAFRQYKYLRLDGGSSISERRDMVMDWQTRPDLFIFLLSTRAGGLGINLTAADTVVFYDSDWNPSNDQQAMDRAHRLGQKKQVTVYRLITTGTIDERILKLARTKKTVQDAVVGSSSATANANEVAKPNEVVSLLLDEDELEASMKAQAAKREALKERQSLNGIRGVKIREEKRAERLAAAASSTRASSVAWPSGDDDDEAFTFFAAQPANGIQAADNAEDEISVAKASEGAPAAKASSGAGSTKKASSGGSRKRKAPSTAAGPGAGAGGEPRAKKKSKLSKEL